MSSSDKIYLDSCSFIDLAKTQQGSALDSARKREIWFAGQILRAGRAKDVTAFTSTLTFAECLHIDKDYSPQVQQIFRRLLSGASGVIPIQLDIFVIERARDLRWKNNIDVKPLDSLHLAAALEAGCSEFVTTDSGILARMKSAQIAELGLRVILASDTSLLPDEYRQQGMTLSPKVSP